MGYWLSRLAPLLAGSGFAVYAPHYFDKTGTQWASAETILDGKHFPVWLAAARDAIGFAAARPKVDAGRVALIGISLGGYLAVAAGIEEAVEKGRVRAVIELSGGLPTGWAERVSRKMAPVLLIHGEQDSVVPVSEARELQRVLAAHGVNHRMELFPGETHWFSQQAQARLLMLCSAFLSAHL